MNAKNSSSWVGGWLTRSAVVPVLGGVTALGLLLGSLSQAEDTPWRGSAPPRVEPDVLPPNLPISPLAPRPGDVGERPPEWHNKPNEGPMWLPSRPVVSTAPMPRTTPAPAPMPREVEVLPMPRLVPRIQPVQLIQPTPQLNAVQTPSPSMALPTVEILPIPPDKPLELPKPIPLSTDEEPKTPAKSPQKLAPPREMQPEKLPPVESLPQRPAVVHPATPPGVVVQPVQHEAPPAMVPNKHGFGSPDLTLSRDRQLLDLFQSPFSFGESRAILGDGPAVSDRSFAQAEYLLWWVNAGNIPVLAATGREQRTLGYLGQPGTEVLLGPGSFGSEARNGFRTRVGTLWDTPVGERGLDGSFFFLGKRTSSTLFDSSDYPTISRPFFAANFNSEFGELVAFPGLSTGALLIEQDSQLWGADANFRIASCRTCGSHAEWFAGYRYLSLEESLGITEFIVAGPQAPDPQGTNIIVTDAFEVKNHFHGAQVGWAGGRQAGRWSWDARFSLAMGVTQQQLDISGTQQRQRPGQGTELFTGGLLAAGPNIGRHQASRFSVVPEATFNIGYLVTPLVKVYVGYNAMLWTNVLRPGDQIDRVLDLTFVPNAPNVQRVARRPLPTFKQSDLWIQGMQFGVEAKW